MVQEWKYSLRFSHLYIRSTMCNEKTEVYAKSKPVVSQVNFFDGHLCILLVFMLMYTKPLYKKKNERNKEQKKVSQHGRYIEIIILLLHTY